MTTLDTLLTDELHIAAAAGVAAHAPDLAPLTRERFFDHAAWWLVPDDCGDAYKAELALLKTRERTIRITIWILADRRGGDTPAPHSHPWKFFRSHILLGGYREERYELRDGHVVGPLVLDHRAGDANDVDADVWHEVTAIRAPGRTLTLMVCGPGEQGAWDYLDIGTGERRPAAADPGFAARLDALNPHQRMG